MGRLLSLQPLNNGDWGKGEPLNPATGSQPRQTPVLTLAGLTYTADTASYFVINVGSDLAKQTLVTSMAVQLADQLIIAGATYTADSASLVVQPQSREAARICWFCHYHRLHCCNNLFWSTDLHRKLSRLIHL